MPEMTPDWPALLLTLGPVALLLTVALGCGLLPVPLWPVMLLAGALGQAGEISAATVLGAGLAGAMLGDALGYAAGRSTKGLRDGLRHRPRLGPLIALAEARLQANAFAAVFLTRWLIAPLGPYVNLAAGFLRVAPWRFGAAALAGRALWLGGYFTLGWVFARELDSLGANMSQISRAVLLLAAAGAGLWLLRAWWRVRAQRRSAVAAASQSRKAATGGWAARASGQTRK